MKTIHLPLCTALALYGIMPAAQAQETRAFNQNASRSNHTRLMNADPWSIGFNAGASFATKSNQSSLFRGNSFATKLFSTYFFDQFGIGISTGVVGGSIDESALNSFIDERKYPGDLFDIQTSKPFNSYLLAGPSVRFGNRVTVIAGLQGGLFFNDPGSVSISQQAMNRALYSFQSGDQKLFAGFAGNLQLAYPINTSTQFVINADYLQSNSSIRLLDPAAGVDIPTQQSRSLNLVTAGVGIIKSFGGSGASAKKQAAGMTYNDLLQRSPNQTNNNTACGPVTQRTTNTDGTVDELVFSCPDDAAAYTSRLSMNVTTPKQTQGSTFGEKVSTGLQSGASALSQGASRYIISGKLSWLNAGEEGIVTNKSASPKSLLGSGSGAASASYARTTAPAQPPSPTLVKFEARDAASGRPSGKREKGSGLATGRRQYEPAFSDNDGILCNSCLATIKNNPLYTGNGTSGSNPLHTNRMASGTSVQDGMGELNILLIDIPSGSVLAQTKTEANGSFFFANVPEGDYTVKLAGSFASQKSYEVVTTTATDLAGTVGFAPPALQLYMQVEESRGTPAAATLNNETTAAGTPLLSGRKMIPVTVPDITGNGTPQQVGPIKGVIVKGGHNHRQTTTNEKGEFEFTDLEPGTHTFTVEHSLQVADETNLVLKGKAQDHNSSRSNKSASISAGPGDGDNQKVQDHNSSRSNKSSSISTGGGGTDGNTQKVQDHNSSRSNKSASAIAADADWDGDGVYETNVLSKISDQLSFNEQGDPVPQQKAGISTSRSNIRTRSSLQPIGNDLYIGYVTAEINNKIVPVKIIYK